MSGLLTALLLSLAFATNMLNAENLTIGTWNIQKGNRWDSIVREIRESPLAGCDVVALQEVLTAEEGGQARRIADVLQAKAVYAGSNVIITKLPVLAWGEVPLRPGRRATWADLQTSSARMIRIYSVHLSYKRGFHPLIPHVRKQEMESLLSHAESFGGPVVVAGDFNTVGWFFCCHRDAPLLTVLRRAGYRGDLVRGRTQRLLGKVDWIFTRGMEIVGGRLGNYAGSDHRWMTVTMRWPQSGSRSQPHGESRDSSHTTGAE